MHLASLAFALLLQAPPEATLVARLQLDLPPSTAAAEPAPAAVSPAATARPVADPALAR